ncbi:hypothetical protein ACHAXT_002618 [Thalassiosira profunda]
MPHSSILRRSPSRMTGTFLISLWCTSCSKLADAFTAPVVSRRTISIRRADATARTNTKLYEQPINLKKLLGPISPSALEKYELAPEILTDAWSAQLVQRTAKSLDEATDVQLVPNNPQEHFVDSLQVEVPIPKDSPGLGIELLELQGGRDDGLGITIVSGLVPGGNAERAVKASRETGGEGINYGDAVVAAELVMSRTGSSSREETQVKSVQTECLGYDATVEALGGMLSSLSDDENGARDASVVLTLKRIRRRPRIDVTLHYPPEQDLPSETIQLQPGDNLRMVMLQKGIKLNDPLAQRYDGKATGSGNCGGGSLCRTCAVSVLRGGELLSRPKENERKMMQDAPRWRLACKSWVGYGMEEGEIVLQVNPRQW